MNDSSLEILINVPLKYPEVNAIKYNADNKTITLEFALMGMPGEDEMADFQNKAQKAGRIYHEICGNSAIIAEITVNQRGEVSFVSLVRDEENLTEEEIDIYIALLKEYFDNYLLKDRITIEKQDSYKRRLKKSLLHKINEAQNCSFFWAFRQGGKVFVLNK